MSACASCGLREGMGHLDWCLRPHLDAAKERVEKIHGKSEYADLESIPLIIGKVSIHPGKALQPGKIWLEHKDGEGGEFDLATFEKLLEEFFWREF